MLNFQGLGSNSRPQQTSKGSADEFSLQSCDTITKKWWTFHSVGLGYRRRKSQWIKKGGLLKLFAAGGTVRLMKEDAAGFSV